MSNSTHDKVLKAGEIARLLSYFIILIASVGLFFAAYNIPTSRFETLGAGAFPQIVCAVIGLLTMFAIVDSLRKISYLGYGRFYTEVKAWMHRRYLVFITLGALALYILVIPIIGFSIASMIFIFTVQVILMPRTTKSIVIAFITALVFSFGLNWLFAEVFTVFLPRGVF
jgi:hypothetical protein